MDIKERTIILHDFQRLEARLYVLDEKGASLESIAWQIKNIIRGSKYLQEIYNEVFNYLWDAQDEHPFDIHFLRSDLTRLVKAVRKKYDF